MARSVLLLHYIIFSSWGSDEEKKTIKKQVWYVNPLHIQMELCGILPHSYNSSFCYNVMYFTCK